MPEYYKASDLEKLAQRWLGNHPTVVGADFGFIFREKAMRRNDKPVIGKARTVPSIYQPLMERQYDFIIEIGYDVWKDLPAKKKDAWMDHLLSCCHGEEVESTGEMKYKTRKPTFSGFPEVISRHGVDWDEDLNKLQAINLEGKNLAARAEEPEKRNELSQGDRVITDMSGDEAGE